MSSFQLVNDGGDPFDGDLAIEDNSLFLTTGVEAIRQHIQIRFRLFLGEWFLDTDVGVPWFRDILIKKPSFVVVQEILKNVILETQGVIELTRFAFDYNSSTRSATLEFSCVTTEGIIDFSQVVEV